MRPWLLWRELTLQEEEKVGGDEFISGQHRSESPCCVPCLQDISVYRNTPSARVERAEPSNMSARVVPFHRTRTVSIFHVPDDDRLPEQSLNKLPSLLAKEEGEYCDCQFMAKKAKVVEVSLVKCANEILRQIVSFED